MLRFETKERTLSDIHTILEASLPDTDQPCFYSVECVDSEEEGSDDEDSDPSVQEYGQRGGFARRVIYREGSGIAHTTRDQHPDAGSSDAYDSDASSVGVSPEQPEQPEDKPLQMKAKFADIAESGEHWIRDELWGVHLDLPSRENPTIAQNRYGFKVLARFGECQVYSAYTPDKHYFENTCKHFVFPVKTREGATIYGTHLIFVWGDEHPSNDD